MTDPATQTEGGLSPCPYCGTGPCLEPMPMIPGTTARQHPGCYRLKRDTEAASARSAASFVTHVPKADYDALAARLAATEAERDRLKATGPQGVTLTPYQAKLAVMLILNGRFTGNLSTEEQANRAELIQALQKGA